MADEKNDGKTTDAKHGDAGVGTADAGAKKPDGVSTVLSDREKHLEEENKKLIAERDAAKKKARESEEKQLADQNEFKKLYETAKPELESLRQRVTAIDERTKAKLASAEKTLSAEDKAEYEAFIFKLADDDKLEWINARQASKKPSNPSSPGAGSRPSGDGKTITQANLEGMTPLEQAAYFSTGGKIAG